MTAAKQRGWTRNYSGGWVAGINPKKHTCASRAKAADVQPFDTPPVLHDDSPRVPSFSGTSLVDDAVTVAKVMSPDTGAVEFVLEVMENLADVVEKFQAQYEVKSTSTEAGAQCTAYAALRLLCLRKDIMAPMVLYRANYPGGPPPADGAGSMVEVQWVVKGQRVMLSVPLKELPPELFVGGLARVIRPGVEVWQLGCMLYTLATGQEVSVKLQDGAAKGLYNLDFISEMPMLCFVLKMALADKPSDRPTLLGLKRLMKLGGLWLSESVRRLYEWSIALQTNAAQLERVKTGLEAWKTLVLDKKLGWSTLLSLCPHLRGPEKYDTASIFALGTFLRHAHAHEPGADELDTSKPTPSEALKRMLSAFGHRVAGRLPYLVPCLLYVLCEHLNDADGFRAVLGFDAQTKGAILTALKPAVVLGKRSVVYESPLGAVQTSSRDAVGPPAAPAAPGPAPAAPGPAPGAVPAAGPAAALARAPRMPAVWDPSKL